tara:strand:- start:320 stop:517 length:198 start_codon:yes stop_codon:yes gene_type:complete
MILKPKGNHEYIPAEDCLIIPVLNMSWCDFILASEGLFFRIGINDFEISIKIFKASIINNQLNSY